MQLYISMPLDAFRKGTYTVKSPEEGAQCEMLCQQNFQNPPLQAALPTLYGIITFTIWKKSSMVKLFLPFLKDSGNPYC
jgi:hypothetical protein